MWRLNFAVKSIFRLQRLELAEKAYDDAAISRTTIFEWYKRFREGGESVKDDERSGRPTTSRTGDIGAVDKNGKRRSKRDVSASRKVRFYGF